MKIRSQSFILLTKYIFFSCSLLAEKTLTKLDFHIFAIKAQLLNFLSMINWTLVAVAIQNVKQNSPENMEYFVNSLKSLI
jgi:hypothetical protein